MKNNNFKFTYIVEGECDKKLLIDLKTNIFKNRTLSQCKECNSKVSNVKNGTITIDDLKKFNNKCNCKKIVICDYDGNENNIKEISNYSLDNKLFIFSNHKIEIVLLAIFTDKLNVTDNLENKISRFISKNYEYKHCPDSINKILKFLENDESKLNNWIKNLEDLNKKNISNFIELVRLLKGE